MAQNRTEKEAAQTGRVLSFRRQQRPPQPVPSAASTHAGDQPDDDLAQYEQDTEDLDYRHRMVMNVIAVAIVAALIGLGVWIADTIASLEKYQDCVLQGRGNCAPIEAPSPHHE